MTEPIEGAELLQRILEAPEDQGPRLVYADWLQQMGDPRGEFISVQCELSRQEAHEARLDLRGTKLGEAGFEGLLSSRSAKSLEYLGLRNTKLSDRSATLLSKANLPQLRTVNLSDNDFTPEALTKLLRSKSLEKVWLYDKGQLLKRE